MIVNQNTGGAVASSNNTQGQQLRIEASGKAFKAMVDSIYRDKPSSIVRELCTNALDGHTQNGNPERPFEIHLPDIFEPYFSVRDYGCSMNPDQVYNIWGVLFKSSKDTDNTQTGGFGLGGKNFLAYQDSGTLIAYLDGKKYNYVLMYDETGLPILHNMGVEDTAEENGIYVEVAVKEGDQVFFKNAVKNQLRWLKVKPILLNNSSNMEIDTPVFDQTYGEFNTFDTNSYANPRGFWAVQGQIGYPIDLKELALHLKNKDALDFFNSFSGGALYFDVGDILVTLAREDIQYDKHTIASIEKFIGKIAPIMAQSMVQTMDKLTGAWEKMVYLNANSSLYRLARLVKIDISSPNAKLYSSTSNSKWQIDLDDIVKNGSDFAMFQFESGKRKYLGKSAVIIPNDNIEILVRDESRGAISKLKWFESLSSKKIYVIEHRTGSECMTPEIIASVVEKCAGFPVKKVSALVDAPKDSFVKRGSPIVYQWNPGQDFDNIYHWTKIYDEEDIEHGCYITFNRFPHTQVNYNKVKIIKDAIAAKLIDKKDIKIYAIKDSKVDLFSSNVNFITLDNKVNEIIDTFISGHGNNMYMSRYAKALALNSQIETILTDINLNTFRKEHIKNMIDINHEHLSYMFKVHKITKRYIDNVQKKKINKLHKWEVEIFNQVMTKLSENLTLPTLKMPSAKNILARYPQLAWLDSYDAYHKYDEIIKYIEFMDNTLTLNKQ